MEFRRNLRDADLFEDGVVHVVQVGVEAVAVEELIVRALLDQLALTEHDNLVGPANGREAVRDDDSRPALEEAPQGKLDLRLGVAVDVGRRLVEDEYLGGRPRWLGRS